MTGATYTFTVDPGRAPDLRLRCMSEGFTLEEAPHAFFQARADGAVVTFYRSGKLVVQGRAADEAVAVLGLSPATAIKAATAGPAATPGPEAGPPYAAALARHPMPLSDPWIGTDEAGKGDYFGPLAVAGVAVFRNRIELLAFLGVRDSKTLGDRRISELAPGIRQALPSAVVAIGPARYNELHRAMGNVNRLLAWAHARVIENLLALPEVEGCTYALSDQFGDRSYLERALMAKGRSIRLDQRPRAEEDPAVAAASILARDEFLKGLAVLGRRFGVKLARGAGPPVLATARSFVERHGAEALRQVAKVHFATTEQVLGHPLPP